LPQTPYSSPSAHSIPRRYRPIAVVTLTFGLMSVFAYGYALAQVLADMQRQVQSGARGSEAQTHHDSNVALMTICIVSSALALLLISGAVLLYRSDSRGVGLQRAYAILQLLLSVLLAAVAMNDIYNSPAGMMFYFGMIPGAVAAILPIAVLVLLSGLPWQFAGGIASPAYAE
jgi:hypothetical protein